MRTFGTLKSDLILPLVIDPDCDREEMFIEAQGLATKLGIAVRFEVDGMTCTLPPNKPYHEAFSQYRVLHRKALANAGSQ